MKRRRKTLPNGRDGGAQRFIMLTHELVRRPAFRTLPGASMRVLIEMMSRYDGKNNGAICLSWSEAKNVLQIGREAIGNAFAELEGRGFIVCTREGHWWSRQAATWRLTMFKAGKEPPSYDYRQWQGAPLVTRRDRSRNPTTKTEIGPETRPHTVLKPDHKAVTGPETRPIEAENDALHRS